MNSYYILSQIWIAPDSALSEPHPLILDDRYERYCINQQQVPSRLIWLQKSYISSLGIELFL